MVGSVSKQYLCTHSKPVTLRFILRTTKEGKMRYKLIPRFLLFAGLCVFLVSGELWLIGGLAAQGSRLFFQTWYLTTLKSM